MLTHIVLQSTYLAQFAKPTDRPRRPFVALCLQPPGEGFFIVGDGRNADSARRTLEAHAATGHRACQPCREALRRI
jgi:hypothetical protein